MQQFYWRAITSLWVIVLIVTATSIGIGFILPGGTIAFESNRQGNSDIFLADIHRRILLNVTEHLAQDTSPAWSPDGRYLAFETFGSQRDARLSRLGGGGQTVYITDLEDKARTWRAVPRNLNAIEPSWSPNGNFLAFTGWTSNMTYNDIFAISVYDHDFQQMTDTPEISEYNPSFSQDGELLLYGVRHRSTQAPDEVYVMRYFKLGTGLIMYRPQAQIETYSSSCVNDPNRPDFSPPSNSDSTPDAIERPIFYTDPTDPREVVCISNLPGADFPTWTADGRVMFMYGQPEQRLYITTITPDGEDTALNDVQLFMETPRMSSDGKWLVFSSADSRGSYWRSIYVMRTDGTELRRVTFGNEQFSYRDLSPTWRPR